MAKRRRDTRDSAPEATSAVDPDPTSPPIEDPTPEPAPVEEPPAPSAPEPNSTPNPKNKVVMGPAAVDPTAVIRELPITAAIFCGVTGQRPLASAGFQAWAKANGHIKMVRAAWNDVFETYKNSAVRS